MAVAARRRRRRRPVVSLLLAIVFFALAGVALLVLRPIDTRHTTIDQPTPGQVTLPPTATPQASAVASPTS